MPSSASRANRKQSLPAMTLRPVARAALRQPRDRTGLESRSGWCHLAEAWLLERVSSSTHQGC